MLRKIILVFSGVVLFLVVLGIKMREYQRDDAFQYQLMQRLSALEQKQDEILQRVVSLAAREAGASEKVKAARPAQPPAKDETIYSIHLGATPVRGNKNARVTIVEFSDFECPFSQRFHPVVAEVLNAYPQDVNYVFKSFPLPYHPQTRPATKALWAAHEQGKYWEMLDALFVHAKTLHQEKFQEIAEQIGLDVPKFLNDLIQKDSQWEKIIEEDMRLAKQVNFTGTPTFYLNGKKTDARTFEAFKNEIDQLLK